MSPHLSAILGDDHASHTYVRNKPRAASLIGMSISTIFRPSSVSQEEMVELIDKFNRDRNISGLLVQLPHPGIETVGKNVFVVGSSKNVGMPIAMLLHSDRNHERPGAVKVKAGFITPEPGGVGPMTITMVMKKHSHCCQKCSNILNKDTKPAIMGGQDTSTSSWILQLALFVLILIIYASPCKLPLQHPSLPVGKL
ncbi:probable bifunctional methylenetetrahydrofolate dehydrogenase/cyclohydrolase 2 [Carassius carassius]|uniref:probable bifunctional methylenetetrahydrofolate dehydrogenase/cyclohydrolase 2 n=1 Tax=Carassius carassius TaxID=217509 RepID=UPI00286866A5|nr:probable bifunctional methylenetetrahydrofolate dehydrogenase/cyclohydrolase 2 [Carassius carassius]